MKVNIDVLCGMVLCIQLLLLVIWNTTKQQKKLFSLIMLYFLFYFILSCFKMFVSFSSQCALSQFLSLTVVISEHQRNIL